MRCQQCESHAVMPKSKSCLNCGFKNPDNANQQIMPHQESSAQDRYLKKLHKIRLLAKKGQVDIALQFCHRLNTQDHKLHIKQMMLEARLWQLKNKPDKALHIMKKLKTKLPFNKKNLIYYYRLACLLQQVGQYPQAIKIFRGFIDHRWEHFRDDIKQRYQQLKHTNKKLEFSI